MFITSEVNQLSHIRKIMTEYIHFMIALSAQKNVESGTILWKKNGQGKRMTERERENEGITVFIHCSGSGWTSWLDDEWTGNNENVHTPYSIF